MRRLAGAVAVALLLAGCGPNDPPKAPDLPTISVEPAEPLTAPSPDPTLPSPDLSAKAVDGGDGIPCKDGTVSRARQRRGACSHHGGIE